MVDAVDVPHLLLTVTDLSNSRLNDAPRREPLQRICSKDLDDTVADVRNIEEVDVPASDHMRRVFDRIPHIDERTQQRSLIHTLVVCDGWILIDKLLATEDRLLTVTRDRDQSDLVLSLVRTRESTVPSNVNFDIDRYDRYLRWVVLDLTLVRIVDVHEVKLIESVDRKSTDVLVLTDVVSASTHRVEVELVHHLTIDRLIL